MEQHYLKQGDAYVSGFPKTLATEIRSADIGGNRPDQAGNLFCRIFRFMRKAAGVRLLILNEFSSGAPQVSHFQHPFHPNDGYLIPDALRRHGDLSHSDVGGRPRITGTFDEVPEDYETGTPVTQALNDWRVREYSATRFEFIHNPPESEDLTDAAYNAYSPARAMAVWLESIRTAGPAVGSDLNAIGSYDGERRYTWDQGVGAGALVFRADQAGQVTENGHIVEFGIIFERVTGTFNRARFAVQLATATITLSGSTQTQKPVRGSYSNPHRVSRVEFSDHHWKEIIAGQPITVTRLPGSDEAVYIPDGAVGIIQFEDLPANPNGVKLLPSYTQAPMVGAMHSQGSTAGRVVMLQPPPNMVEYPGALRPFRVHNLDAAYNLAVKFWDGTFVIVLQPGEHIHLQFSANRDGTGFVIGEAPDRHHRASGAALGDFATRGYWLDENDDKYYLLQLPDWTFNSPDGFVRGNNIYTGTTGLLTDATDGDLFTRDSRRILKPGWVDWRYYLQANIRSGSVSAGHEIQLWRKRPGADIFRVLHHEHWHVNSAQEVETYPLNTRVYAEENDLFLMLMWITDAQLNTPRGDFDLSAVELDVTLQPEIRKAYP